jgi:ABC-type transport system substrate-binding protein
LLYFNCAEDRLFHNVVLRRAFTHVINFELAVEIQQQNIPFWTVGTLFAGMLAFHDTSLPPIQYSIVKAVSILATGGYRPTAV